MIVTAFNPELDQLEQTFLSQSYSLGVTSIEVKNNQRLNNNNRLLLGDMGLAQSEIVTAGTPNANGTTLPITAVLFSHPANTPIYQLLFDQVKFYRSTTGINGTYLLLATINLDVTNEDLTTTYNDTTAQAGYYYKVSMFNSVSLVESAQTDPIPANIGWAVNQVGYTVDQVFREISDPNEQFLSRDEMIGYFNDVNDDLKIQAARPYRFLYTRQVLDRAANSNTLLFPTDSSGNSLMWKFDRLDYRFVDNTVTPITDQTYTVEVLPLTYWRNRHTDNTINSTTTNDQIQDMALNDATDAFNYFPASATTSTYGCFYLYYWSDFVRITTEGQYFQTYSPHIYKLYTLAKYYRKRAVTEPSYLQLSDRYMSDYNTEKAKYKSHDRKDQGTPRRIVGEDWVTRSFRR